MLLLGQVMEILDMAVAVTDEMIGVPLERPGVREDFEGRPSVPLPSNLNLSQVECRILELSSFGLKPETVARRCRVSPGTVERVLRSTDGEEYIDWLIMQRELDQEYIKQVTEEMRLLSLNTMLRVMKSGKPGEQLAAAKEWMDRDPQQLFVKTTRREEIYRGNRQIDDPAKDNLLVLDILGESPQNALVTV